MSAAEIKQAMCLGLGGENEALLYADVISTSIHLSLCVMQWLMKMHDSVATVRTLSDRK